MERVAVAVGHELTEMPGGQSNERARLEAGVKIMAELGLSFKEWRGNFSKDEAGRVKVRLRRAKLKKLGWFVNRDGVWDNPTMTRLKNGDVLHGVSEEVKIANSGKHGNPVWYGQASGHRA
jgi:hypothetical protein